MRKIYLATPYTDPNPAIRVSRFLSVNKIAAQLMSQGHLVFSPISHTHPIALAGDLPKGWEFWAAYDLTFIEWADELHVYMQDGWEDSVGVTAELVIAKKLNIPVVYIEEPTHD